MTIDGLTVSINAREVIDILANLPLPQGVQVSNVRLSNNSVEGIAVVPMLFNVPVKFRVEILSYSGSKVNLKVFPPVKQSWITIIRPILLSMPGTTYEGNSVIQVDLLALSRQVLSSVNIDKIAIDPKGVLIQLSGITSKKTWKEVAHWLSGNI